MHSNWLHSALFGLHYDLHANERDVALGKDVTFDHIFTELSKVRPDYVQYDCKGHPGYASYPTKIGTPAPGIVSDALKVWREVTRKMEIPLIVHFSGIWDDAAIRKHPNWACVNADGSLDENKTCTNSAYTDQLMIPQMIEVIDWYDVDGFWVDGENWAAAPCYCETCKSKFRAWSGIESVPESPEEAGWSVWLEFCRKSFENHVRKYVEAVHRRKPGCLVCGNWMYSIRQPEEMTVEVDYLSGDFTPSFGCKSAASEGRFLDSRGVAWNLMSWGSFNNGLPHAGWTYPGWAFKTAEHLQQEAAEVLMNGGSYLIYETPQRTGHLVGWRHDILAEVADFCRERRDLCLGTKSVPQVALLHNPVDYYAKNDPLYCLGKSTQTLEGALHSLLQNNLSVDVLNDITLIRRINEYPLVVIPEPESLRKELVTACEDYVHNGGNLLVSGAYGPKIFGDILGVEPVGEPETGTYSLLSGREMVSLNGLWQSVRPKEALVISDIHNGEEPELDSLGKPAATINCYGKGKAIGVYGPVFSFFSSNPYPRLRRFVGEIVAKFENREIVQVEAPSWVEISLRRKDNKLMLHLLNKATGHPLSLENHAVENVPATGPIRINMQLTQKPGKVFACPEDNGLVYKWSDDVIQIELPSIHIHTVFTIELSSADEGNDYMCKQGSDQRCMNIPQMIGSRQ